MNRRRFVQSFVAGALAAKVGVPRSDTGVVRQLAQRLRFEPGTTYEIEGEIFVFELTTAILKDHFQRVCLQLSAAHWVYEPIPKPVIKISEPPTFAEARNWIVNRGGWVMPYYTPDDWEHMLNG